MRVPPAAVLGPAIFWQNPIPSLPRAHPVSTQDAALFRFADCELDVRNRQLRVRGEAVTLAPKVFDTLALLVTHAGEVLDDAALAQALWPEGGVPPGNVGLHIARLRATLGGDTDDTRYIESTPGGGYRWCASPPADAGAAPAAAPGAREIPAAPVATAPGTRRNRPAGETVLRRRQPAALAGRIQPHHLPSIRFADQLRALAIAIALLVLLGGGYWWLHARLQRPAAFIADPHAVAIMPFANAAAADTDAWLGAALPHLLATAIDVDGRLHVVPAARVRAARSGLAAAAANGYGDVALARLRQRLGARYIVTGTYGVASAAGNPQLQVRLVVQDAGTERVVATLTRAGASAGLPRLLLELGADLRRALGEPPAAPATQQQLVAAQPPDAAVARALGHAWQTLAMDDLPHARAALLQAVAQAPAYAPAWLELSRVWAQAGYHDQADAAVQRALQHAAALPRAWQLQARIQQAALAGDAATTVELRSDLVQLRPADPEARLAWIQTLIVARRADSAAQALAQARTLPAFAGDPRIELAASRLAAARGDHAGAIVHAREGVTLAQLRDAPGLAADAALQLGGAYGNAPQAEAPLRTAVADYQRTGNPHGEAQAWQHLARLQGWRGDREAARASYRRALAIYQATGSIGDQMTVERELAEARWRAGDATGTGEALRQVLDRARETGDAMRQAWALTALATALSDAAAGAQAETLYQQAITLDRKAEAPAQLAFAQASYAGYLRLRGQFDAARAACAAAQATARTLPEVAHSLGVDVECAQIALDRGEVAAATAALTAIVARAEVAKDAFDAANARTVLGQIALGRGQFVVARATLQQAFAGWSALQQDPAEATTAALLAQCAAALHDPVEQTRMTQRAQQLRVGINARAEVFDADVALAQLAATRALQPALGQLQQLAADASQRQWPGLAFEARLGALRVLERAGATAAARAARTALVADARRSGYGWIAERAAAPLPAPPPASGGR